MAGDLTTVRAKHRAAVSHLNTLQKDARRFFALPGQAVAIQRYPGQDRYGVVYLQADDLPIDWTLTLSDALNNLRSALNYLVTQIVIRQNNAPGRHNSFPLFDVESDWISQVVNPKRGPGPLGGVNQGSAEWDIIERAQPYKAGDLATARATDLSRLQKLNNFDKHTDINETVTYVGDGILRFTNVSRVDITLYDDGIRGSRLPIPGTVLEPNTQIGYADLTTADGSDAKLKIDLPTEPAFDGVPLTQIGSMMTTVKDIIDSVNRAWARGKVPLIAPRPRKPRRKKR